MPSWISEENLQKALNNGINYHTLYSRIKNGWTIKEATTIPVHEGVITKEEKKSQSQTEYPTILHTQELTN